MFIRAHEAGYMCVATLSERDLPVLASERCPYKLFSQGCAKHQKDLAVLFFVYQLATGSGHNQPRLSFDGYFKA